MTTTIKEQPLAEVERRDTGTGCNVLGVAAQTIARELDDLGFPDVEVDTGHLNRHGYRSGVTISLDLTDARRLTALLRGVGA